MHSFGSGMLWEESPTNAKEINELIGAFLLDIGIANDETEALVRCSVSCFCSKTFLFTSLCVAQK